jgi:uncharacterized alkaline shock family protein YloU
LGILDRLFILLSILFLIVSSLTAFSLCLGILPLQILETSFSTLNGRFDLAVGALLVLFVGIRLLYLTLSKQRRVKSIEVKGELGNIKISLQAIENLVHKVVREVPGVRQTKAKVKLVAEGVEIGLKAVINPEHNIPRVAETLQELIGQQVQETMGIRVEQTEVLVENISGSKELKNKIKVQ